MRSSRRFAVSAGGFVVGFLLWQLAWLALLEPRLAGVVSADFGISATVYIVGTILTGLFGLFGGRKVDPAIGRAVEGLRAGVTDLGRELANVASRLGAAIVAGLQVLGRFLGNSFGPLLRAIGNMWNRIIRFLDKLFGPIIAFLQRLKDEILRFYNRFVKPIVDAIEIARRVLQLLSLFNIEWAKKLDQQLYELERRITAPFDFMISKINEALNWINRIVALDGLLQRVMLIKSTWRDIDYLTTQFLARVNRPLTSTQRIIYGAVPEGPSETAAPDAVVEYMERGSGPIAGLVDEAVLDAMRTARLVARGGTL